MVFDRAHAILFDAFQGLGSRPQFFMEVLGNALSPLSGLSIRFEPAVQMAARQRLADDEAQMELAYLGLKPLDQAVLWRLLEQGQRFVPTMAMHCGFYQEKSGASVQRLKSTKRLGVPAPRHAGFGMEIGA